MAGADDHGSGGQPRQLRTDANASRFDPLNLTTSASLNRARIVDLPGLVPDPDVRGLTGHDLLGTQALSSAIAERAAALGLAAVSDPAALLPAFGRCLTARDPAIHATAHALARHFGRSLGYLLLMLRRGDPINQQAREDWDASAWSYWAAVRTVWLGGGTASGRLGARLRKHATDVLRENGEDAPAVHIAQHALVLPLVGAARSLPPSDPLRNAEKALLFDFGGTSIKRAVAIYTQGALSALSVLPSVPTSKLAAHPVAEPSNAEAPGDELAWRMADVIAAAWRTASQADPALTPHVVVSIASYVRNGHPLAQPVGVYKDLAELPHPATGWLARLVSERVGQDVAFTLLHDGTAAARTYAGRPHSAIIMLGTALGVSYPPPDTGALRPIAHRFALYGSVI